jgi:Dolichyl-phosphate-mannose-protein mannosyltransferase
MMLIPIFVFSVWWLFLMTVKKIEWRSAFLKASLIWGFAVVVITEALSTINLIRPGPLLICWLSVGIPPVTLLVLEVRRSSLPTFTLRYWRDGIRRVREAPGGFCYCVLIMINTLAVLVIALVAPPNNHDALAYHMARVASWYANQSVAHYVTAQGLQIYFGPWAEFAILQFYTLGSGNDLLANCVQWFAFVGSMIAASLCARELGGRSASQFLAAAFVATIPMALHQANSAQNDLVCGYFVLGTAFFLLSAIARTQTVYLLYGGLSCGLALATKGTAYPLLAPLLVGFSIWLLSQGKPGAILKFGAILLTCTLLVNAGWWLRNYAHFGRPLGPPLTGIVNNPSSVAALESNLIRNAALQLTSHNRKLNGVLDSAVRRLHQICNLDVNAPETTYQAQFTLPDYRLAYHEDVAANLFHFVLMLLVVGISPLFLKNRGIGVSSNNYLSKQIGLSGCILCSALLFCLLFKYQQYGTRLQLPLFLLGAAPVGVALGELSLRNGSGRNGIAFSAALLIAMWLFVSSLPHILYNGLRPLVDNELNVKSIFSVPRQEQYLAQYLAGYRDLYMPCVTVIRALKGVTGYSANRKALSVGIQNPQGLEYPFWQIARHEGINARFCFIGRTSVSVPDALNQLDAVIVLNPNPGWSSIEAGLGSFGEMYASPKARLLTRTALK